MPVLPLGDGANLRYREAGAGQPVVLLHGWSMRKEVFDAQFDALAGRFHLVAPDFRGHGESSPVDGTQGIETLAEDIAALLLKLDLSNVVLVGWSMGAMVAWQLMKGPAAARVAGLVVIDMVPRILSDDAWPHGLRKGEDASTYDNDIERMQHDWPAFVDEYVPNNVARGHESARAALLQKLTALVQDNRPDCMARLWHSLAEQDLRAFVQALAVPTLIVHGEQGQLYSNEAFEWMEDNTPNSRRVSFSDSGHAPHMEESERFNAVLKQFADGLRGEPADASVIQQKNSQPERPS